MKVLIVDDEPALRSALARALRRAGHDVELAGDGRHALDAVAGSRPDAVVLDVSMPGLDGVEVCRRMRAGGDRTPVLMLTARDAIDARVAGLDAGADDYLVKPFAPGELHARLRALTRRTHVAGDTLGYADVELDVAGHRVTRAGEPVEVTKTELALLRLFLEHPEQVLTRSQIFTRVWGYDFGNDSNTLGVYVGYLRRKLGEPQLIHTVRGVGYVLRRESR
jgi:two-component system response regulator MprA